MSIIFGSWPPECHMDFEQVKRIEAGRKLKKDIIDQPAENAIRIQGSSSEPYVATLSGCSCTDFQFRNLPCKHMYCLADQLGLLSDLPKLKAKGERSFDPQEEISRFRELYASGDVSADAYVKICSALAKLK